MYERILVAVDGSENSMRAVEQVKKIASYVPDAQVIVVSVIVIDVYSDVVYDPVEAHGESQNKLVKPAVDLLEGAGVNVNVELLHGRPADEIVRFAEKCDADLVVVGSRGLNAFQEFAIGSVSHKVIKHVKCPVLVVK